MRHPIFTKTTAIAVLASALICHKAYSTMNPQPESKVDKKPYGKTQAGDLVDQYTLTNKAGAVAKLITYGAILTNLEVPDRHGKIGDVVIGFDTLPEWEADGSSINKTIGRFANRIAKGKFTIDGQEYTLPKNNGENTLHGGPEGYGKRIWNAEIVTNADGPSVKFTLHDPDGKMGFPGNVDAAVVFTLTEANTLRIDYTATTDKATPINLTNHSYFNLLDAGKSTIYGHELQINADKYTPVDATLIPTGVLAPVAGTPIDFTTAKPIGKDLKAMGGDPVGYDHNLVLRSQDGSLAQAAIVTEPKSGRVLEVWTTEPGIQLYSGNFLDGTQKGKHHVVFKQHHAFCLETQHYPDSPNQSNFPSSILKPGDTFHSVTEFRFSVKK